MDSTTSSLVGQPPIAVELIEAIKAADPECGEINCAVSTERIPQHRVHFADRDAAERLHKRMDKSGTSTVLNTWDDPLPNIVVFGSATRTKKAIRFLREGPRPRKPTGKMARAKALARTRNAPLPLTSTQAKRLVAEINADFVNLGQKLLVLRERRGWQALGYGCWDACVRGEFSYTRQHANRLIKAEELRARLRLPPPDQVEPTGSTSPPRSGDITERQARELGRLPDEQQIVCYQDYLDECREADVKPRATGLRKKVDAWLADNEPYVEPGGEHEGDGADDHRDGDEDQAPVEDHADHAGGGDQLRVVRHAGQLRVDDHAGDEPPKLRGKGVFLAHEAIDCLKRIPKNDKLRARAWEIVRDWLDANEPEAAE